ncbi:MAG: hypothetical protein R3Y56_02330 [Akkermansia sp.]
MSQLASIAIDYLPSGSSEPIALLRRGDILTSPPTRPWEADTTESSLVGGRYKYVTAAGNAVWVHSYGTARAFATRAEAEAWAHNITCELNLARSGNVYYNDAWDGTDYLIKEQWDCTLTATANGSDPELSFGPDSQGHEAWASLELELRLTNRQLS